MEVDGQCVLQIEGVNGNLYTHAWSFLPSLASRALAGGSEYEYNKVIA
jgi:hypothetical protein